MIPILGRSILKRGENYQKLTLLEGLRLLFNSEIFLEMYERYDIQVNVYGHPDCLIGTGCQTALNWIQETCAKTSHHKAHKLFYAIGESPIVGEEAALNAASFTIKNGRVPTFDEQVISYYGAHLPPVDFFIMTSKMGGMGALPNLLVNGDTEIYYLPTVMGLTEINYRLVLYDLLFRRAALRHGINDFDITPETRHSLMQAYEKSIPKIIGTGFSIGNVWIMNDDY
jgi:hypothetical protein